MPAFIINEWTSLLVILRLKELQQKASLLQKTFIQTVLLQENVQQAG